MPIDRNDVPRTDDYSACRSVHGLAQRGQHPSFDENGNVIFVHAEDCGGLARIAPGRKPAQIEEGHRACRYQFYSHALKERSGKSLQPRTALERRDALLRAAKCAARVLKLVRFTRKRDLGFCRWLRPRQFLGLGFFKLHFVRVKLSIAALSETMSFAVPHLPYGQWSELPDSCQVTIV